MGSGGEPPGNPTRRGASRLRVRLPAFADLHSGTVRVVLCDLSLGGAKVFTPALLPIGRDVLLRWGAFDAFGTVIWERDGLHGIRFEEPLPAAMLIGTRDLHDAGSMTRNEIAEWLADHGWDFGKALD